MGQGRNHERHKEKERPVARQHDRTADIARHELSGPAVPPPTPSRAVPFGLLGLIGLPGLIAMAAIAGCMRPAPTLLRHDAGSTLDALRQDGQGADGQTDARPPDGGPSPCKPTYGACRISFPSKQPVLFGGPDSQDPDVAYGNDQILVTYQDYNPNVSSAALVGFDRMGNQLFAENHIGGINNPSIAWNRALGVGAIAADSGVRWLDSTGHPVGDFIDVPVFGNQAAPTISPTADGFVVVAPVNGYEEGSRPITGFTFLGPTPQTFSWQKLTDDDEPWNVFACAEDANGMAQWFASNQWFGGNAGLWSTGASSLTHVADLTVPAEPSSMTSLVIYQGKVYGLWVYRGQSLQGPWLVQMEPPVVWDLNLGYVWGASLTVVGDDLVFVGEGWHGDGGLAMARLDLERDDSPLVDIKHLVQGPGIDSWRVRTCTTPDHGFAVVWGGGNTDVRLLHLDCCLVE